LAKTRAEGSPRLQEAAAIEEVAAAELRAAHAASEWAIEALGGDRVEHLELRIGELDAQLDDMKKLVAYLGNTVHQAYHQDSGVGWRECEKSVCREARKGLTG
jgi:hypothetical protein